MNYASISRRFGAVFLDFLILIIPGLIIGSLLPVVGGLVLWFLYAPFLESSVVRATIGKKLMGIQVTDLNGGRISFRAAMVRALMKLISSCLMLIPHLLVFFTERRQALHDIVAETVVVYGRADVPIVDAWSETAKEVFNFSGSAVAAKSEGEGAKLTDLERLQSLYERGALSKEEFESEKAKILSR